MKRSRGAVWRGGLKDGKGIVSTESADAAKFQKAVETARSGCPVSKLLNAKITLDARLV